MNEPWLALFAAINPAAVLLAWSSATAKPAATRGLAREPLAVAGIGAVAAAALYVALILGGPDLLESLDIAPETFRIAAGTVMAVSGVAAVLRLGLADEGAAPGLAAGLFPLAVPLLASAAGLMAGVSYGVDQGRGQALASALILVVATAALTLAYRPAWRPLADPLARLTGALLVALAAALIVEGVRDI